MLVGDSFELRANDSRRDKIGSVSFVEKNNCVTDHFLSVSLRLFVAHCVVDRNLCFGRSFFSRSLVEDFLNLQQSVIVEGFCPRKGGC